MFHGINLPLLVTLVILVMAKITRVTRRGKLIPDESDGRV